MENKFESPTQLWLHSEEHVQRENDGTFLIKAYDKEGNLIEKQSDGWEKNQIEMIPTKECIDIEKMYLESHVTVYHATTKASYAMDLFCRKIQELIKGDNSVAWIRSAHAKPPKQAYQDIEKMKEIMSNKDNVDNKENNAWHILSCNPTLWHNADYASEESTVNYYFNNSSVIQLDFTSLLSKLLDESGLLVGQGALRAQLYKSFYQLINDAEYGAQGVLYQYTIPHHLVNQVAYISGVNGIVDQNNTDALATLVQLKTPGGSPHNHSKLQVRLFVPELLKTENANEIIVSNHLSISNELRQKFEQGVLTLATSAFEGPTEEVKLKVTDNRYMGDWHASRANTQQGNRQEADYSNYSSKENPNQLDFDDLFSAEIAFEDEEELGNTITITSASK